FMDSKTVSTAISALVLVMPVRLTTSLMMSSLIKTASRRSGGAFAHPRIGQPHDRIEFIPMSSDSSRLTGDQFRQAAGRFATGIAVATVVDAEGAPHGLTVNSFTSVSLDPPLVLVCVGHITATVERFRTAKH